MIPFSKVMSIAMRNYDKEAKDHPEHQYAYNFDLIMHRFLMRTFMMSSPHGKALEMGCYHGDFTKLIKEKFSDVTVVEASKECIALARERAGSDIKFLHGTFEGVDLTESFDTIFLIHTLEHIEDRVGVLHKVNNWL